VSNASGCSEKENKFVYAVAAFCDERKNFFVAVAAAAESTSFVSRSWLNMSIKGMPPCVCVCK